MARPPAVARVLERATATMREHRMVEPGERLLVAVSGGPDSIVLLHTLVELRRLLRIDLAVFHFDHRLRRGSRDDAAYVARQAARLDLPFALEVATTAPPPGSSVEDWAHRARYAAFARALGATGSAKGATGHTLDDQAESVLVALLRGGGISSLAGIDPVSGPFVRPLIGVTRAEVEAFARARRLRPRTDPTNADTGLLRNAVRRRVLPTIERATGRDPRATLARSAAHLRRDAAELDRQADAASAGLLVTDAGGVRLPVDRLLALPDALASRVVLAAILAAGVAPTSDDVDAVLDLARGRPGRRRDLGAGAAARRESDYLSFTRPTGGRRGDGS